MVHVDLLLRLLIAHILAEFLFQNSKIINHRRKKEWKSIWLLLHAFVYALFIYTASSMWTQAFWLLPTVFISHWLIDGFKSRLRDNLIIFILDQTAHILIIIGIWIILSTESLFLISSLIKNIWYSEKILLIILGYLLILWPSGFLIKYVTEPFRSNLEEKHRGLERAGYWIGILERFLTYSFILSGYEEAIALLVTAKSIFRIGEIKDPKNRKEAEYILIGSLLSFGLALTLGYVVKKLIK
jgi:hypothetical protein